MSWATEVAADSPLAWWRLGESSGTTAADGSGNSHAGTYSASGLTLGAAGAIQGDANTGITSAGAGTFQAALDLSARNKVTLEFWVKLDSFPAAAQTVLEYTVDGSGTNGFGLTLGIANPTSQKVWQVRLGSHFANFGADKLPELHVWHHCVIELDRTAYTAAGAIKFYLDGIRWYASQQSDHAPLGGNFANSTLYAFARNASSQFLVGGLDEVVVYNGLLSEARITAHYVAGHPPHTLLSFDNEVAADSPLVYWKLNETTGTTAADSSGNSHPGTYSGTLTLGVDGPLDGVANGGKAVSAAGAGAVSASVNLSAQNKLTIEFWLYWPSTPNVDQMILEYTANGGSTAGGFSFSNVGGASRLWRVAMGTTSALEFSGDAGHHGSPKPDMDRWNHVVIELDRTKPGIETEPTGRTGSIRLWINAVPYAPTGTFGSPVSAPEGGNFANSTLNLLDRSGGSLFATAKMARVAVYSGLLAQERIDAHYLAGSGVEWVRSGAKYFDVTTIFPNPHIWKDLLPSDTPYHASSRVWTDNLMTQLGMDITGRDANPWHATQVGDPGLRSLAYAQGSVPIYVVPADQPRVAVANSHVLAGTAWDRTYNLHKSTMAGVPIPDEAITDTSGDWNLGIYSPDTGEIWELWLAQYAPGVEPAGIAGGSQRPYVWKNYGGGYISDLSLSDGLYHDRFDGTGYQYEYALDGTTATSIPGWSGLVTLQEWLKEDPLEHSLQLIVGNAWTTFLYPAKRGDGELGSSVIPEGAWVRIRPEYDLSTHFPDAAHGGTYNQRKVRLLAEAAQKYGIFITDKTHIGCAFRMGNKYAPSREGFVGDQNQWLDVGADGYIREWDVMGNFPWGLCEVIDPTWVQTRWPVGGPAPPTPVPAVAFETLTDDFSGGSLDPVKYPAISSPGASIINGQAVITCTPAYSGFKTGLTYYLSQSHVSAEIVEIPTAIVLGTEAGFRITSSLNTDCYVQLYVSDGNLVCEWRAGDDPAFTRHLIATPVYDPVAHRWWRIRKASNNVYWDTSPDGSNWNQLATVDWATSGWPLDTLDRALVWFFSGNYLNQTLNTPGNLFVVDNVNVAPSGPPPPPPPPAAEPRQVKLQTIIVDPDTGEHRSGYVAAEDLFEGLVVKDPLP